jgi:tyrosine phenol-lyase
MKNVSLKSVQVRLSAGHTLPVEMHKIKVVQKVHFLPVEARLDAMRAAGFNTFLLKTGSIFLDMLTDSGMNAMSDQQLSAMMVADDAYAGSESFDRLQAAVKNVFGQDLVLPVHQGRAAEHIIAKTFVKAGDVVPMNYHFTTTRAHIELIGGRVLELYADDALQTKSSNLFKGNIDLNKLERAIHEYGPAKIPYIRMEASTNLLGGQPFSMSNLHAVSELAKKHGIMLVIDASLIGENAYFIKRREAGFADRSVQSLMREMTDLADITYISARKSGSARGGLIMTRDRALFDKMRDLVPLFEGFLTYGGMSTKEIEAIAVGLTELADEDVAGSTPTMVEFLVNTLDHNGVPVITPPGALGCHVDAMKFLPHVPQQQYPAGALAAAFFIISGVRGMERGTISTDRDPTTGEEIMADLELLRLAVPRRTYTLSQVIFAADRMKWLYEHRDLVGGLKFVEEPAVLRFFVGRLDTVDDWPQRLVKAFRADFGAL